jgi:hypothetical protein
MNATTLLGASGRLSPAAKPGYTWRHQYNEINLIGSARSLPTPRQGRSERTARQIRGKGTRVRLLLATAYALCAYKHALQLDAHCGYVSVKLQVHLRTSDITITSERGCSSKECRLRSSATAVFLNTWDSKRTTLECATGIQCS